ncbi:uncharacterized protein LOC113565498 isoform X1 [Drosophila persimilis]|uniref:uncharacterized protein LOC113565498 isoform X1 n=1 Tax=Drosophila persimilis TaxID=7234 RepID=UPI000F09796F|nr:uncharacterized protein LOC113565498 isoform X1 [Drosophila persimilis]
MREEQNLRLWRQMKKKHGADRLSKHEWKILRADFLRSWNTLTFDKFSKDQLAEATLREELQETTRAYSGLEKGLASRLSTRRRSTKLETNPIATSEGSIPPAHENTGSSQRKPSSLPLVLLGLEKDQTQSSKPSRSAVKARTKPVATPDKLIALPREPTSLENVIYIVKGDQSRLLNRRPNSRGTPKLAPTTDGHIELETGDQKRSSKASQSRVKTEVKLSAISDGSVPPTQEITGSSKRKPMSLLLDHSEPESTDQSQLLNCRPSSRPRPKLAPTSDGHIELEKRDKKRAPKPTQNPKHKKFMSEVKSAAILYSSIPPQEHTGSSLPLDRAGTEKGEKSQSPKHITSLLPLDLLGTEKGDQSGSSKHTSVKPRTKSPATPDGDIPPSTLKGSIPSSPVLEEADFSCSWKLTKSRKQRDRILERQREDVENFLDDVPLSELRKHVTKTNGTETEGKNNKTIENNSPSKSPVKRKPADTIPIPLQPIKRRRQTHVPISHHLESVPFMPKIEMVPAPTDLSTDILEESAEIGIAVRKIQELMDLEKEAEIVDDDPEFVESPITACCTDKKIDLSHENNVEHTEIMTLFELGDEGDRTPEIDRCLKIFTTKTPSEIDDQLAVTTEFFERLPNSSKFDLEKADLMEEEEEVLDYEEDGDVDDDVLSVTATSWDDMEEEEKQPEPSEASLRNFRIPRLTKEILQSQPKIMCSLYNNEALNEKEQEEPQRRTLKQRKSSWSATSTPSASPFVLAQHVLPPLALASALPLEATPIIQPLCDQGQNIFGHNANPVAPAITLAPPPAAVRTPTIHTLNEKAQRKIKGISLAQTQYSVPPSALSIAPSRTLVRSPLVNSTNDQEGRKIHVNSLAQNIYTAPSPASVAQTLYSAPPQTISPRQDNRTLTMQQAATVTPSLGNPRTQAITARHVIEPVPKFDAPYRSTAATMQTIRTDRTKWFSDEYWMLNLFGVKCLENLDDVCSAQSCNHTFTDIGELSRKLMRLDVDSLLFTYQQMLMRWQRLFLTFAPVYVDIFEAKNLQNDLLHLLMDCRLYKSLCASIINKAFTALKNMGLETQATLCIMEYLWMPRKAHNFTETTLTILKVLGSSNWYNYTDKMVELCQIYGFSLPTEVLLTILSAANERHELKSEAVKFFLVMGVAPEELREELTAAIKLFAEKDN